MDGLQSLQGVAPLIDELIGNAPSPELKLGELVINIHARWKRTNTDRIELVKVYPDEVFSAQHGGHVDGLRHLDTLHNFGAEQCATAKLATFTFANPKAVRLAHFVASFATVALTGAAFLSLIIGA